MPIKEQEEQEKNDKGKGGNWKAIFKKIPLLNNVESFCHY